MLWLTQGCSYRFDATNRTIVVDSTQLVSFHRDPAYQVIVEALFLKLLIVTVST